MTDCKHPIYLQLVVGASGRHLSPRTAVLPHHVPARGEHQYVQDLLDQLIAQGRSNRQRRAVLARHDKPVPQPALGVLVRGR